LETCWEEGMRVNACGNLLLVNQFRKIRIYLSYVELCPAFNLQIGGASYQRFS
jgi:hypothetical protein